MCIYAVYTFLYGLACMIHGMASGEKSKSLFTHQ
jgi:hypothetical protein